MLLKRLSLFATYTLLTVYSLIVFACGVKDDFTVKDSPTTGKITVYFDEGLTLHVNNQINTFKTTYKYADISLKSSNENDCISALFNDSSKAIIINRKLTASELQKFEAKNIHTETSVVAKNAIAFIVGNDFPDSTISITELKELLRGNNTNGFETTIIFDNQNSGSAHFLKDSLLPNVSFGASCSATNNTKELIDKISKTKNAIGVCDYAWLSDKDDTTTKEFLKTVKILAVSKNENETAYMPDQSNIATGDYPLCKTLCVIRRSAEFSLAKGVQTFIAGEKGQLMFLKQGLPPNRQEERVIEINMEPMKMN